MNLQMQFREPDGIAPSSRAPPTARGLHISYISGSARAFAVISGPIPAGSPTLIPINGFSNRSS